MIGFIYAIECAGRVKIGFSMDPEKRFNKVASDAPFPCRLMGYWAGGRDDEDAVHEQFASIRLHGEWFALTDALSRYIERRGENVVAKRSVTVLGGIEIPRGLIADIAQAVGRSPSTLSRWKTIPAQHVRNVSKVLGMPPAALRPDIFEGLEAFE